MIAIKLHANPGSTILDPCAGEGIAIRRIASQGRIELKNVTAIELDSDRSEKLKENLPGANVCGCVDFLSTYGSSQPTAVYCNPPFADEIGGGGIRTELKFVNKAIDCVQDDGVVVIVIPETLVSGYSTAMQTLLMGALNRVTWMKFPEVDRKFNEIVIFGYKRKEKQSHSYVRFSECERAFRDVPIYDIPIPKYSTPVVYRKREYTEQELEAFLETMDPEHDLFRESPVTEFLKTRPPMPLRSAHVSMLLASGLMNGLVEAGAETHVVRGVAKKVKDEVVIPEGKEITIIETERISLSIKTVDLKGNIKQLTDKLKTETEVTSEDEGEDDGEDIVYEQEQERSVTPIVA